MGTSPVAVTSLNILLSSISQPYFKVRKTMRLNATHNFILKIPNKKDLASNRSSDIDFKDFMKLYKDYTKEPHSFSVNDTTLSSDNPLQFRKNGLRKTIISEKIKAVNNKIEQNETQYNLDRQTAKISALST